MVARWIILVLTLCLGLSLVHATDLTFWGPGVLGDARAVGLAPNGEIWAGCSGKIGVFSPAGVFLRYESAEGQVNAIIFDGQGKPVIGYNDGFVSYYYGDTKVHVTGFGGYSPWDITLDAKGHLYAADNGNGVAKEFDISGMLPVLMATYKAPADDPMARPYSLALDAQQRLYVTDERKKGLCIFDKNGVFLRRVLGDQQCWRVRARPDGIYVITDQSLTVIKPETGEVLRKVAIQDGNHAAMGFAIGQDGSIYFGHFYDGVVRKLTADGTVIQTMGPSYRAILTLPDAWTPGNVVTAPLRVDPLATKPLGVVPPAFTVTLQPVGLYGEADSNYANLQGATPDPSWEKRRQSGLQALEHKLAVKQEAKDLLLTVPAEVTAGLYRLQVHADHQAPGGESDGQFAVRVTQNGVSANLTLYVPHQRSVFQQGEQAEIDVILRSKTPLPVGTLRFSLPARQGDALAFQPGAPLWKEFPLPATDAKTFTYHINAANLQAGRYILQAEYLAGAVTLRDTWPLEIVTTVQPTRFRILFPEWSAGYTDIWGIFTGKGMRADAAGVAREGILLYDTLVVSRNQDPPISPSYTEAQQGAALMAQAAADPSLPAPERYMPASPLEIELQEALRNGLTVQRDIWGSHFLDNWGMAHPLGMARDNRLPQLWTQWQREWPSWIGHRYLTLSIDEGDNPERVALKEQLKLQGLTIPTEQDLQWLRNGMQRQYISDAPAPVTQEYAGIGGDAAGNVYLASRGGVLVKYAPDGAQVRTSPIPSEVIDLAVAANGTVYVAHMGNVISITDPEGKTTTFQTPGFNGYSPRGICLEKDGNILASDEENGRVVRISPDGKQLAVVADKRNLQRPAGLTTLSDGTIVVLDSGRGGLVLLKPDGTPVNFLAGIGGHTPGGKGDVVAGPDDTLWATEGWGGVTHADRTGKRLGNIGRNTFAPGGMSLPMSVAMTARGNLLVSDVALPFAQEFTLAGDPVHMFGLNTLFADVRIDRQRYIWTDHIIATVWIPVAGQEGLPKSTLQAFARQGKGAWTALPFIAFSPGEFGFGVPQVTGSVTLRLVWAPPGATPDYPMHADYALDVQQTTSAVDAQKAEDLLQRQLYWKQAWAKTRMGTLVRWTQLSNVIRPGTQNTAPTNYGTPDSLAEGVWVPWRRDAVVAEAENTGHDHGDFPLMGPWYVARALEGPNARPAWASLLQWYWNDRRSYARPTRDTVVLLGAGASGIGTGTLVTRMNDDQLALHRKMVDRLRRLGDATMNLELPGRDGVAVLHSFTQEAVDPYMEEHFYTAHAAWYDLLRAHIPTAVVSEESIAHDALLGRFKAVLLPCIQYPLPPETLAGLERFRKAGGEVWVDLATRITVPGSKLLLTRYRPFWAQDAYYTIKGGYGVGGYDGNFEYWRMKQGSDQRLPAIRTAFGRFARMPINTDDADVFLQERRGGLATYLFAGNDHYPNKPLYQTTLAWDEPAPATVPFSVKGGVVYDALAMTRVKETALKVDFTNDEPARV